MSEIEKAVHYNAHSSGIEARKILRFMSFNVGTAFKYLFRIGLKAGEPRKKDLLKCEQYLLFAIEGCEAVSALTVVGALSVQPVPVPALYRAVSEYQELLVRVMLAEPETLLGRCTRELFVWPENARRPSASPLDRILTLVRAEIEKENESQ